MASLAKITLIGNLGGDPETRYTPQGTLVVNFSLAVNNRRRDASGNQQESTNWYRISAFGRLAETMVNLSERGYLTKGKQIYVDGQLRGSRVDRPGRRSPHFAGCDCSRVQLSSCSASGATTRATTPAVATAAVAAASKPRPTTTMTVATTPWMTFRSSRARTPHNAQGEQASWLTTRNEPEPRPRSAAIARSGRALVARRQSAAKAVVTVAAAPPAGAGVPAGVVRVAVVAASPRDARSASSASTTSSTSTTRTCRASAATLASAARSSHAASLAPAPGTSAR